MIDYITITSTIESRLKARVDTKGITFQREKELNKDPRYSPWCGIYKGRTSIAPRTIGRGSRNKRLTGSVKLYLQVISASADKSGQLLDENLDTVTSALDEEYLRDKFNSTISNLLGYDIDYLYEVDDKASYYYQTAVITLNFELIV